MAGISLKFPVVAVCSSCEGEVEVPYYVNLGYIISNKARILPDLKEIYRDAEAQLEEAGWYVAGEECFCPDCKGDKEDRVTLDADARTLLREAKQLIASGRPAALLRSKGDDR